jgi:hypothetical protein
MSSLRFNERSQACKRTLSLAALILSVSGFCGCQTNSPSAAKVPPTPPSAGLTFCESGFADCSPTSSFSVSNVRDLKINVAWENVPAGNHIQKLEVLVPSGGLYQQTTSAFAIPENSTQPFVVTRNLPVAGTWIQQRQITGEWTVRVSLDGQDIGSQAVQLNR